MHDKSSLSPVKLFYDSIVIIATLFVTIVTSISLIIIIKAHAMELSLIRFIKNNLNAELSKPLYVQLKDSIEMAINNKMLVHGSVLLSERKLAQELAVSRVTIVKALAELQNEGTVVKQHGKGTVIQLPVQYDLAGGGFSSQLKSKGKVTNRWIIRTPVCADDFLARKLGVTVGDVISHIKRVRLIDNVPVSIETTYIPQCFMPRPDLLDGSLYEYWETMGILPKQQDYSLSIYVPTADEALLLDIPKGSPLMRVELSSKDQKGVVLEYGTAICRSDFYRFNFKTTL